MLSDLPFKASDYPCGIFKLFLLDKNKTENGIPF
jgi:hypothetical protein